MYLMYDDVNYDLIPANPHAVIHYINGHEGVLSEEEARKKFPHARLLGMSVTGKVPAPGYDVERGDYTPDDVPELYHIAIEGGIWRPCFYGELSGTMPEIKAKLNTVVKARGDVRLLVADWDDIPIIPTGYDGKQFTDKALGRSLDESILLDTFFKPEKAEASPSAAPTPEPDEWWEAKVGVGVSGDVRGRWRIDPLPAENK